MFEMPIIHENLNVFHCFQNLLIHAISSLTFVFKRMVIIIRKNLQRANKEEVFENENIN